jgi:hypothetical protein
MSLSLKALLEECGWVFARERWEIPNLSPKVWIHFDDTGLQIADLVSIADNLRSVAVERKETEPWILPLLERLPVPRK